MGISHEYIILKYVEKKPLFLLFPQKCLYIRHCILCLFFYLENTFSFPILTCIDKINHPYVDSVSGTALIVGESQPCLNQ